MTSWFRRTLQLALATVVVSAGMLVAQAAPASAAATATADTVVYWNNVLLEAFRRQGGAPTPLSRAAAIVHGGVFDLLNAAKLARQGNVGSAFLPYAYYPRLTDASIDDNLAAGIVARDLIIFALPGQRALAEQKFTERHGTASQPAATAAAAQVVTAYRDVRTNDGSQAAPTYTVENVPGAWRPTGHLCTAPATPQWGRVKPFWGNTANPNQRPAGATSYASLLTSDTYTRNFNEVKELGRSNSTTRTAEQTRIAWFWANDLDGTYKPPGQLLDHTRIVARAKYGTAALETARLFAMTSIAMADAGIAGWNRKFDTPIDLWRPETAIQLAASDNNPNTAPVTGWRPLSADRNNVPFSPCFPAWVSGHAIFGGAWAGVMRSQFGDSFTFTATTEDPHAVGVTRTFTSFTAAAVENARSRIYLGVHYQIDADDGTSAGLGLGEFAGRLFGSHNYQPCTPTTC